MHGLVLLDAADEVLRPAILWNDQRTAAECDEIREAVGPERLIAITGNDALTGFTAPKLVWVRDHEPEVWARVAHVLLPKDYVRLPADRRATRWTRPTAPGTHPVRPRGPRLVAGDARRARDRPGVAAADVRGPGGHGRRSTAAAAAATGLRAGTPVVAGGGDQAANAVGVGRGRRRASWRCRWARRAWSSPRRDRAAVRARGPGPRVLPRGARALAHDVGDAVGRRQPALVPRRARARAWRSATLVDDGRPRCRAGSDGLLFLPYLTGERSPHPDPLARGAFVGLTLAHDRRHLTRAVLEGVAFGLRDGLDLMVDAGMPAPVADPRVRRRHGQPGLAPDPRRRPGRRDRDRRARPRAPPTAPACWRPWARAGSRRWRRRRDAAVVATTAVAAPGPDAARYAELHAALPRALSGARRRRSGGL